MLEAYLLPPWLLFMLVTSGVALIASFMVSKDNDRLQKEIDDRAAVKKAGALEVHSDNQLAAHG